MRGRRGVYVSGVVRLVSTVSLWVRFVIDWNSAGGGTGTMRIDLVSPGGHKAQWRRGRGNFGRVDLKFGVLVGDPCLGS